MKNTSAIIIFLFVFFSCSQNKKEELEKTLQDYFSSIENKETEKMYSFYDKDFAQYLPKDYVDSFLGQLKNRGDFEYNMRNFRINYISEIIEKDSVSYVVVKYTAENHTNFTDTATPELIERVKKNSHKLYGDNYRFDEEKQIVITQKEHSLIVIYKDSQWSFIPGIDKLRPHLHNWIPKDIIDKLIPQ